MGPGEGEASHRRFAFRTALTAHDLLPPLPLFPDPHRSATLIAPNGNSLPDVLGSSRRPLPQSNPLRSDPTSPPASRVLSHPGTTRTRQHHASTSPSCAPTAASSHHSRSPAQQYHRPHGPVAPKPRPPARRRFRIRRRRRKQALEARPHRQRRPRSSCPSHANRDDRAFRLRLGRRRHSRQPRRRSIRVFGSERHGRHRWEYEVEDADGSLGRGHHGAGRRE